MADIPSGTTTTASISLGGTLRSRIGSEGDRDWVRLELERGDWAQIDLRARGSDPLGDPYLRIHDAQGRLLAKNDDADGLDSQVVFRAAKTGAYYIEAAGLDDEYIGQYEITATRTTAPRAELPLYWGSQMDDPDISVYFAPNGVTLDGYTSNGWTAYEKAQFGKAFDMLAAVAGLTFTVTTDPDADFRLVLDTDEIPDDEDEFLGQFNPPGVGEAGVGVFNGAVWNRFSGGDLREGGLGFVTIVHELLHGLGLAHPHDRGGDSIVMPGVDSPFDDYGDFNLNQGVFTTMTYNSGYFTGTPGSAPTSDTYGHEAGPMALDIAVLQALYGANTSHATGDGRYVLPGSNAAFTRWETIWDTGGHDIISYSGGRDVVIDLRAATLLQGPGAGGYISAADGIAGGYTIAAGTVIEDARSSRGDDWLMGNTAANTLIAGQGHDFLRGRSGHDRLEGREGNDMMRGDKGDDQLIGGNGRDRLEGGDGRDLLRGETGHDTMIGGAGNDNLSGGRGADVLHGGYGQDKLKGGIGLDTFRFYSVGDTRPGEARRDVISDFKRGVDVMDIRKIDADVTRAGDQAFDFIGKDAFSGDAGELRNSFRAGDRLIQGDQDGDGEADFEIWLISVSGLAADDFLL